MAQPNSTGQTTVQKSGQTQLAPGSGAVPNSKTPSRLILEDPLAFDSGSQPLLRSSLDINTPTAPIYTPEQAREMWESLSMEPEAAFAKQQERRRLLARAESAAQDAAQAKAQAAALQTQLDLQEQNRLNHPLVYAGAIGLIGLGALYLMERRKRIQLHEQSLLQVQALELAQGHMHAPTQSHARTQKIQPEHHANTLPVPSLQPSFSASESASFSSTLITASSPAQIPSSASSTPVELAPPADVTVVIDESGKEELVNATLLPEGEAQAGEIQLNPQEIATAIAATNDAKPSAENADGVEGAVGAEGVERTLSDEASQNTTQTVAITKTKTEIASDSRDFADSGLDGSEDSMDFVDSDSHLQSGSVHQAATISTISSSGSSDAMEPPLWARPVPDRAEPTPSAKTSQSKERQHVARDDLDLQEDMWNSRRLSWWEIIKQTVGRVGSPKKSSRHALHDDGLESSMARVPQVSSASSLSPTSTAVQSTLIDLGDAQDAMQWLEAQEMSKLGGLQEFGFPARDSDLAALSAQKPTPPSHASDRVNTDSNAQARVQSSAAHSSLKAGSLSTRDTLIDDSWEESSEPISLRQQFLEDDPQAEMEHLLELRTAVNGLQALGRPQGALALLEEYIDDAQEPCAWAYLEAMRLCERLDERQVFETLHQRYRQMFQRMAPTWFEPNGHVLGLDGYARAATEISHAWVRGAVSSRGIIAAWLVGPTVGRKLLQLPAYHDLLDLYELTEHVSTLEKSGAVSPISVMHAASLQPAAPAALVQASFSERFDAAVPSQPVAPVPVLDASAQVLASELSDAEQDEDDFIDSVPLELAEPDDDFVPTVSLLDLDYEFSSDVTLEEKDVQEAERSVTVVKPGNFSVDFNVAGTQLGGLFSVPAELGKK